MRQNYVGYIEPPTVKRTHHRRSSSEATYEDRKCGFYKSVQISVSESIVLEIAEDLGPRSLRQSKKVRDLEAAVDG
jgi:hypothetical protein